MWTRTVRKRCTLTFMYSLSIVQSLLDEHWDREGMKASSLFFFTFLWEGRVHPLAVVQFISRPTLKFYWPKTGNVVRSFSTLKRRHPSCPVTLQRRRLEYSSSVLAQHRESISRESFAFYFKRELLFCITYRVRAYSDGNHQRHPLLKLLLASCTIAVCF